MKCNCTGQHGWETDGCIQWEELSILKRSDYTAVHIQDERRQMRESITVKPHCAKADAVEFVQYNTRSIDRSIHIAVQFVQDLVEKKDERRQCKHSDRHSWISPDRWERMYFTRLGMSISVLSPSLSIRWIRISIAMVAPDRPMPALQWMTIGEACWSGPAIVEPAIRRKKSRSAFSCCRSRWFVPSGESNSWQTDESGTEIHGKRSYRDHSSRDIANGKCSIAFDLP